MMGRKRISEDIEVLLGIEVYDSSHRIRKSEFKASLGYMMIIKPVWAMY